MSSYHIACPIEVALLFIETAKKTAKPYGDSGLVDSETARRIEHDLIQSNIKVLEDSGCAVGKSAAAYARYIVC